VRVAKTNPKGELRWLVGLTILLQDYASLYETKLMVMLLMQATPKPKLMVMLLMQATMPKL
jgi:hypothetical protein